MNVTFREYQTKDKVTLLGLVTQLSAYSKQIDPISRVKGQAGYAELSVQTLLENVAKFQGRIWFAEDNGKIIGFISGAIWKQSKINVLEIGTHKLGEVLDLYIIEEYRRKGIGKQMLQMMEKYFKTQKCDSMWIQVFEPNRPARNLYNKFGFIDREIGMLKEI